MIGSINLMIVGVFRTGLNPSSIFYCGILRQRLRGKWGIWLHRRDARLRRGTRKPGGWCGVRPQSRLWHFDCTNNNP